MPTESRVPAAATRRRVVLGALGTAVAGPAVAACTTAGGRDAARPTAAPTPTERSVDADEVLVAEVLTAIATTRALVVAVRRREPALARPLAPLVRAHAGHGRALGDLPTVPQRPVPARGTQAALTQVVTAEQSLQTQVVEAAVAARSGSLAAALGSIAASLAQHGAVLADSAGAGEAR